jgi:hypothetical protein
MTTWKVPGYQPGVEYEIDATGWESGPWWERDALVALRRGHAIGIGSRDGSSLYLLRCWITEPKPADIKAGDAERWESSDSVLLHRFYRPDDDEALHDHPWSFSTTILCGSYLEALPPEDWQPGMPWDPSWPGPSMTKRRVWRDAGNTINHRATDLHSIVKLDGTVPTWTRVRVGPKERSWGFHPEGQPFEPWRDYLKRPGKVLAARAAAAATDSAGLPA